MTLLKKMQWAILAACLPMLTWSNEAVTLDTAPVDTLNQAAMQRGAKLFVGQCMSCHSAAAMRYQGLVDIGISEALIKKHFLTGTQKATEPMQSAMSHDAGKTAFGVAPPDLSVISRARGADWIYTYLRTFYKDPASKTGWNNLAFPQVAMPHVLASMQGAQELQQKVFEDEVDADRFMSGLEASVGKKRVMHHDEEKNGVTTHHYVVEWLAVPDGKAPMSVADYDAKVGDLVNFLVFVGEPHRNTRHAIGYVVLLFLLFVLLPLVYFLKQDYWSEVE